MSDGRGSSSYVRYTGTSYTFRKGKVVAIRNAHLPLHSFREHSQGRTLAAPGALSPTIISRRQTHAS
jgi:hypothetical protein